MVTRGYGRLRDVTAGYGWLREVTSEYLKLRGWNGWNLSTVSQATGLERLEFEYLN